MPTPDPRAVLERLYDALNRHDLDDFCEVMTPDCVDHGDPGGTVGRSAMRQHIGAFLAAFPDLHTSLDQVIVDSDGETVGSRTTTTGTHTGELMGIPPTGRQIRVPAVDMARLSGGLIAERWGGLDTFSLLQQLGVVGAPGGTPAAGSAR
jgi:predicted ester cyclase